MGDGAITLNIALAPPAKCKSCPTMIVFAYSSTSGGKMPFEIDPAGEWEIRNGTAVHVGPKPPANQLELGGLGGEKGPPATRYTAHHATCPGAEKWRSRR